MYRGIPNSIVRSECDEGRLGAEPQEAPGAGPVQVEEELVQGDPELPHNFVSITDRILIWTISAVWGTCCHFAEMLTRHLAQLEVAASRRCSCSTL